MLKKMDPNDGEGQSALAVAERRVEADAAGTAVTRQKADEKMWLRYGQILQREIAVGGNPQADADGKYLAELIFGKIVTPEQVTTDKDALAAFIRARELEAGRPEKVASLATARAVLRAAEDAVKAAEKGLRLASAASSMAAMAGGDWRRLAASRPMLFGADGRFVASV